MSVGPEYLLILADAYETHGHLRCNRTAGAAPTVDDDSADWYEVGSLWFYGGDAWVCTDATAGAAVWVQVASAAHNHDADYSPIDHTHLERYVVMRPNIDTPPEPVSNVNGDGWVYMVR